jgi:hypothetical protein
MPGPDLDSLRKIKTFPSLVAYLRDDLDWPIESEDFDKLTYNYEAEELGIDVKNAAKIEYIRQLKPLYSKQPWGIFFVKFEPKKLPVVALRRILGQLVIKKRASANRADQQTWRLNDLLFLSNYGENEQRQITFAHFSGNEDLKNLPTLQVLGWDDSDTALHIDHVHSTLRSNLRWPGDENDLDVWRKTWSSAFTLRHREVIETSKELAIRLAGLAQQIRKRANSILSIETESGPLKRLMAGFKEALIHDLTEDSFADMYAQTIAYGLLSARITNPKGDNPDELSNQIPITNPFLKELMETFLLVGGRNGKAGVGSGIDFDELGINDVVSLLDNSNMEAVLRDFGDKNPLEDPVIHFYELFLHEYDSETRMQRGVFYTPQPVVSFIIRSVDELLRTEFGLENGLADTATWGQMGERHNGLKIPEGVTPDQAFVQILDPATGTGTFLVEIIDCIHKTMTEKWNVDGHGVKKVKQLWNDYVPKHLLPRLHGYEILMAPYAIAHMKIGLKLYETGYRFDSDERTRVYLTNALEPASDKQLTLNFMLAFAHESQAVNEIKLKQRFTVIIGNPPYAGVSANHGDWITKLIDVYRYVDGEPLGEKKVWLKNDYVKFLRLYQLAIELTGCGLVSLITDHSYLDGPTFRGLRSNMLSSFPQGFILNLHGNSKRREKTPDGGLDENVFDITQGVAIATFCDGPRRESVVRYADLWGERVEKYSELFSATISSIQWNKITPKSPFYLFAPVTTFLEREYAAGWLVTDIFRLGSNGVQTSRDPLVIAPSREKLKRRFTWIRDGSVPDSLVARTFDVKDKSFWRLKDARSGLFQDKHWEDKIVDYSYRPFDDAWLYASSHFVHRLRHKVMQHLEQDNLALCVGRAGLVVEGKWNLVFCTKHICDHNLFYRGSSLNFPLYRYVKPDELNFHNSHSDYARSHNINSGFLVELERRISLPHGSTGALSQDLTPEAVFHFSYAIFHSPTYRSRYAEFLKFNYPRLPLAGSLALFRALDRLGSELVALHLMQSPKLGNYIMSLIGSGEFHVEKTSYLSETLWLDKAKTYGFRGMPEEVWNFHIGGYKICEKWLKDRGPKKGKPGRILTKEDIAHYQKIIVAISETIRIMGEIDEVIEEHGGWPGAFVTK